MQPSSVFDLFMFMFALLTHMPARTGHSQLYFPLQLWRHERARAQVQMPEHMCSRSLGAVYWYTTFIRDIRTIFQIRQVAQLRSTTCNLQGLSSTQRSTHTTPSRDLTLVVNIIIIVMFERAVPGVGGGVVLPLSVSVGLALELLLSDVLVGVSLSGLLLDGGGLGGGDGDEGEEEGVFHFTFFKICN